MKPKRFYFDVENEKLLQLLNIHEEKETLSKTINDILDKHFDELLEPAKDEIKQKINLYASFDKKPKRTIKE